MQKRPFVEPIRRKCEDTQSVKQVNYKYYLMPPSLKQTTWTTNMDKKVLRKDVSGVIIKYYHTIEGAEEAQGEGSYINNYTEDQFIRP
tara:strand:- start:19 stop:282 length:264 start_codon:yes stop_codon:yes gene_type:complete